MSVYTKNMFGNMSGNDSWVKLAQFIEPGVRILDIGCSSGNLGAAFKKEKGVYVVGLDIDKDDLALAKKKLDETYLVNIETDAIDKYGKFDVVIMADVIEHLVDPISALLKVKEVLKKGGRFVFSIPNMANVTTRVELLRGRFEYKDFGLLDRTHIHFYDHQEVNRVLSAAGFEVKKTDCPIREIPKPLLKKYLAEIGIELTDKLAKHLYSTDALVYQFVGYAEVSDKPKKFEIQTTSPLDVITKTMDEMTERQRAELVGRDEAIKELQSDFNKVYNELSAILNSKGWKMLKKAHSVKHRINKLTKRQ